MHLRAEGVWQRENDARTGMLSGIRFRDVAKAEQTEIHRFVHRCAQDLAEFLCEHSELSGLTIDDALDIAFCTRMADYPGGQVVFSQNSIGVRGDSLYVVLQGGVNFEARVGTSRPIPLRQIGRGGVFAGTPFTSTCPHIESAVTSAPTTLLEIDRYTFRYLEQTRPGVAGEISKSLLASRSAQIEALVRRIADA